MISILSILVGIALALIAVLIWSQHLTGREVEVALRGMRSATDQIRELRDEVEREMAKISQSDISCDHLSSEQESQFKLIQDLDGRCTNLDDKIRSLADRMGSIRGEVAGDLAARDKNISGDFHACMSLVRSLEREFRGKIDEMERTGQAMGIIIDAVTKTAKEIEEFDDEPFRVEVTGS